MTTKDEALRLALDAQCPVCGYYCLGKGGKACIDKPALVAACREAIAQPACESAAEEAT